MPRKGFKKQVVEFADLESDWKDAVAQSSREEIERRIAKVAIDDSDLRKEKKEDQHLKECANTYKEASARYRDGFKMNKLRIEYMKQILENKGGQASLNDAVSKLDESTEAN